MYTEKQKQKINFIDVIIYLDRERLILLLDNISLNREKKHTHKSEM